VSEPLVSVNMVVFNGERFIGEAIQSILDQTYTHFELIIMDDGSTDNTNIIVNSFSDPRIQFITSEKNNGIVHARNTALDISKGDYIAILDADDISLPDRLEVEVSFLESNPEFGLVGGRAELIDENGEGLNKLQSLSLTSEATQVHLLFKNCFTHSTVMYRRKELTKYNFNANVPGSEDYDVIVKIGSQTKIKNLPDIVSKYRVHDNNISKKSKVIEKNNSQIISDQLHLLGLNPSKKELKIHFQLTKKTEHDNFQRLSDTATWLDSLFISNQTKEIYPEPEFYNRVAGYWFNIFNNVEMHNLELFGKYIKSPILKHSNRQIINHFKYFIKCLIHYSKN